MHDLYPEVMAIFLRLGEEYGLKGRICRPGFAHEKLLSTSAFSDAFYGDNATEEGFLEILENHSCESLEIMCHPAYVDSELYHGTSYNIPRVEELRILTSPAVKKYIAERGIELIHFAGLGA